MVVIVTLPLWGCSGEDLQQPPGAPANSKAQVWGMIIDMTGACIVAATVEVVGGQHIGRTAQQTLPCDAWSYGGGFILADLIPGTPITLRASAPGYLSSEVTVVPSTGLQRAFLMPLTRQ